MIPADDAGRASRAVIAPRRQGVEYDVEHDPAGDRFLILHNDGAEDFALAWTPVDAARASGTTLIPHTPGTRLLGVDAFAGHVVVSLRRDGLTGAAGAAGRRRSAFDIAFPEPIYTVGLDGNPEYDTALDPAALHLAGHPGQRLRLRPGHRRADAAQAEARCWAAIDPADYEQHREWATAPDGTRVPISLVLPQGHRRATAPRPTVLYGYGSYEIEHGPVVLDRPTVPAGPRRRLRDRARPRRRRDGPALVRRRQAAGQEEHLHRLRRLRRAPGRRPAGPRPTGWSPAAARPAAC